MLELLLSLNYCCPRFENIILVDNFFFPSNNGWLCISTGMFKSANNFCSIGTKGVATKCIWPQDYKVNIAFKWPFAPLSH